VSKFSLNRLGTAPEAVKMLRFACDFQMTATRKIAVDIFFAHDRFNGIDDSSEAAYIRFVASLPYRAISAGAPSFNPVSTMPPLRQLAPIQHFSSFEHWPLSRHASPKCAPRTIR